MSSPKVQSNWQSAILSRPTPKFFPIPVVHKYCNVSSLENFSRTPDDGQTDKQTDAWRRIGLHNVLFGGDHNNLCWILAVLNIKV